MYIATCATKGSNPGISPMRFEEQLCFMVLSPQKRQTPTPMGHYFSAFSWFADRLEAEFVNTNLFPEVINT